MGKTYGADPAGRPVDLIGKPVVYRLAPIPNTSVGVQVVGQEETGTMAKATANGTYTDAKGHTFKIRKGDDLPDDTTFTANEIEAVEPVEERAQQAAPENKSRKAAPEVK